MPAPFSPDSGDAYDVEIEEWTARDLDRLRTRWRLDNREQVIVKLVERAKQPVGMRIFAYLISGFLLGFFIFLFAPTLPIWACMLAGGSSALLPIATLFMMR